MMLPVFFRVHTDIADLIELSTGEKVNFLNDLLFFIIFYTTFIFLHKAIWPCYLFEKRYSRPLISMTYLNKEPPPIPGTLPHPFVQHKDYVMLG